MNDIQDIWTSVVDFAARDSNALIIGGLAVTVLILALMVRRAIKKGGRPDKWLTVVSVLLGFAWSAEAMWEIATGILHLSPFFATPAFIVFESMLAVAMMRAERSQKLHKHPSKYGRAAWQIAAIMGIVASLSGDSLVEAVLRFAVPLLVTKQWWDGMTGDGVIKPADAITWTWSPRRILVALGLAKPGEQSLQAVDRERQILNIARVSHRLHTTSFKWRKAWLNARLRSLSMVADDAMLDDARVRVERVWRAADRTRPLEAHEHALVAAAHAETQAARQQADTAATAAQETRAELTQVHEALKRSADAASRATEQIQVLQQQLQQVQRDAANAVEQVRHEAELAIEQARREATVVRTAPANGHGPYATVSATSGGRASVTSLLPGPGRDPGGDSVALPATAVACTEWMTLWIKVCQEETAVALGQQPISEDAAKERFECSIRHLRKVRNAARSGALRRKAEELSATIPAGYVDEPANALAAAS